METRDKNWAQSYINDPLTAPDPSDETGPGSSLRADPASSAKVMAPSTPPDSARRLSKNNPFRQSHGSPKETIASTSEVRAEKPYPSPPPSTSPRGSPSHRQEAFNGNRPRRSSSLRERYPGDPSVRPLDQLSKEKARADRSRYTTKKHAITPDTIDNLDSSGVGHYHHGGPYDATLFARNNSYNSSPVAAVMESNQEALKATPYEKVVDSVQRHRPLDGTATYAPGEMDPNGHVYEYEQGDNMMTEENAAGGPYKRWPGVQYHPDDIKGKGEPSYTIEKALKESSLSEKQKNSPEGIEMTSRSRSGSGTATAVKAEAFAGDQGLARSGSLSNRLKKRVGSLRKKIISDE